MASKYARYSVDEMAHARSSAPMQPLVRMVNYHLKFSPWSTWGITERSAALCIPLLLKGADEAFLRTEVALQMLDRSSTLRGGMFIAILHSRALT